MWIQETPEIAKALLKQATSRRGERKPGWHQSDHNRCLRKSVVDRWLRERPSTLTDVPRSLMDLDYDYKLELKFLRGEGMHNFLSEGKPEFVEYSPIVGWYSIDRLWFEDVTIRLPDGRVYTMPAVPMELKTTDYGSNKPVTEMMTYITQVATYTYEWVRYQLPDLTDDDIRACEFHSYLYILHNRGDYKSNMPDHRAFKLTWGGQELLDWAAEISRRHNSLQRGYEALVENSLEELPISFDHLPYAPDISDHYGFECEGFGRCPLKDLMGCPGVKEDAAWERVPFVVDGVDYVNPVKAPGKGEK